MTTYVMDVETRMLAGEVEEQYVGELQGASPWKRPDLFGFACGVLVDADTSEARCYGPAEATRMITTLASAEASVGYNSAAFDLGVLSVHGDVESLRAHHVDICKLVWTALDTLADAEGMQKRLRQGGLDGLCRANGLAGKTAAGVDAPALYREGRIEELLTYCEADVRLTAALYRTARERGSLQVDPYHHNEARKRVYLPRTTLPLSL